MDVRRLVYASIMLVFAGCGADDRPVSPPVVSHGHSHSHPATGIHGGHLVELGNEEYHAEWLHKKDGKVTIFILNGAADADVGIEAKEVRIVTRVANAEPRTYVLPAVSIEGESASVSRFEIVDVELVSLLTIGEGVKAELVVEIAGRTFRGPIEHDHGHDH